MLFSLEALEARKGDSLILHYGESNQRPKFIAIDGGPATVYRNRLKPRLEQIRGKFQHVWERYVGWGVANPEKFKVIEQLGVSDQITAESKAVGYAPFAALEREAAKSIQLGQVRDYPLPFIAAMLGRLAELTMVFVEQQRGVDIDYCAAGFEIFWNGISRH